MGVFRFIQQTLIRIKGEGTYCVLKWSLRCFILHLIFWINITAALM